MTTNIWVMSKLYILPNPYSPKDFDKHEALNSNFKTPVNIFWKRCQINALNTHKRGIEFDSVQSIIGLHCARLNIHTSLSTGNASLPQKDNTQYFLKLWLYKKLLIYIIKYKRLQAQK